MDSFKTFKNNIYDCLVRSMYKFRLDLKLQNKSNLGIPFF